MDCSRFSPRNEIESAFTDGDCQQVEEVVHSWPETRLPELRDTLVRCVRTYKGSEDQCQIIELLLIKLREEVASSGVTLLMLAAKMGFIELVQAFLRQGYNPNASDSDGRTPLFYALDSAADNADVVEAIFKAGGKLHHVTRQKEGLLQYLVKLPGTKRETLQFLLGAREEKKPVLGAVLGALARGATERERAYVRILVGHEASLIYSGAKGLTPLETATDPEILAILTEADKRQKEESRAVQETMLREPEKKEPRKRAGKGKEKPKEKV